MRGNGGFWNRAGRRSGGERPVTIVVPQVQSRGDLIRVQCDQCRNDNLPRLVTSGCRGCQEVVALFSKMTREERDALYDMQAQGEREESESLDEAARVNPLEVTRVPPPNGAA